jgi:hypothetical protein
MIDPIKRKAFAECLDRFSEGQASKEDRFEYIIEHYLDRTIEEIRVATVRLRIAAGDPEVFPSTDEHRKQLRNWAEELRQNA